MKSGEINNYMVSVIVPCYRQAKYLECSVGSLLHQSYDNIQIILVNDGSDDDTDAKAAIYQNKITYLKQRNMGLAFARNAGLAVASGKYVMFLDADDSLATHAISAMVGAMEGRTDRLVFMQWREFSEDAPTEDSPPGRLVPNNPAMSLLENNLGPPHSYLTSLVMARKLNGFATEMSGCADWDFWARHIFAGSEIICLPNVGAHYRVSNASMSKNSLLMDEDRARYFDRMIKLIQADESECKKHGIDKDSLLKHYSQRSSREHLDVSYLFLCKGQRRKSLRHVISAVRFGFVFRSLYSALRLLGPSPGELK